MSGPAVGIVLDMPIFAKPIPLARFSEEEGGPPSGGGWYPKWQIDNGKWQISKLRYDFSEELGVRSEECRNCVAIVLICGLVQQ